MSAFEQAICQRHIVHMGQSSLVQAVSNCEKRAIGSNGGFGYKSLNEDFILCLYLFVQELKDIKIWDDIYKILYL